jgi:hypothetical protein
MDYHNSDDSDDNSHTIVLSALLVLLLHEPCRCLPTPSNRRWTCHEIVEDLLSCGNPTCIHNQLQMQLDTFFHLQDWLETNTELKSSRDTSIEEKLVIFIYIASTSVSNQAAQERFNCGARSISL